MTEARHTPTPWKISDKVARIGGDRFLTIISSERWIAHIMEGCVFSEEDAALIIKAVNNHQALIDALEDAHERLAQIQCAGINQTYITPHSLLTHLQDLATAGAREVDAALKAVKS